MGWYVKLKGTSDLERLSKLPESSNYRITKKGNEYILKSRLFAELVDPHDVETEAERIVAYINSLATLLLDSEPPVKSLSIAQIDDKGKETQFILPRSIESEAKVMAPTILINGIVQGENIEEKFKDVFDLAVEDEDVSDLLGIFRNDAGWYELGGIYEIIERSMKRGGKKILLALSGLESDRQLSDLRNTINMHRHTRKKPKHKHPEKPYTIKESRQIMRKMVTNWLDIKLKRPKEIWLITEAE
jgi:hypothetical protein